MDNKAEWVKSPITNENHVIQELDENHGVSKMCVGSGFYTNENPLNHKKNPDFDIEKYETNMPKLMKDLRFDDGESYWYPTTIQTEKGMVYPEGHKDKWGWSYTPISKLTKEESSSVSQGTLKYESKLETKDTKHFKRFLEACNEMGEIKFNG